MPPIYIDLKPGFRGRVIFLMMWIVRKLSLWIIEFGQNTFNFLIFNTYVFNVI